MTQQHFISIGHGLVNVNNIIGISDPFYMDTDIKPRKKITSKAFGISTIKTRRLYAFNVMLKRIAMTVTPTIKSYETSSNTKKLCLKEHKKIKDILLTYNKKNEEKIL